MNLPEDAFTEILLRLPVKSLVRFRCVSKSWFAMLKSPHFIDTHLNFSLARDDEHILIHRFLGEEGKRILSFHSNDESLSFEAPNLEIQGYNNDYLQLVGSCNGLVCLSSSHDFLLCNPATRELKKLPPRPIDCPEFCNYRTDGVGFGFDPASNHYKFIRITWLDDPSYPCNYVRDPRRAEIYNLSNDTWRELDVILPRILIRPGFDLFFNGNFHWYAADHRDTSILCLNIKTELFHNFRFPEACQDEGIDEHICLATINNTLAIISYTYKLVSDYPYKQFINTWTMNEYGVEESWSKQHCIGPLSGIECPILVWENEWLFLEIKNECIGLGDNGQLVACNLLNCKQIQKYDIYGFEQTLKVVFYKESLVQLSTIRKVESSEERSN